MGVDGEKHTYSRDIQATGHSDELYMEVKERDGVGMPRACLYVCLWGWN